MLVEMLRTRHSKGVVMPQRMRVERQRKLVRQQRIAVRQPVKLAGKLAKTRRLA
jgi:hypothetical protein